jgi:hypothetical protein
MYPLMESIIYTLEEHLDFYKIIKICCDYEMLGELLEMLSESYKISQKTTDEIILNTFLYHIT